MDIRERPKIERPLLQRCCALLSVHCAVQEAFIPFFLIQHKTCSANGVEGLCIKQGELSFFLSPRHLGDLLFSDLCAAEMGGRWRGWRSRFSSRRSSRGFEKRSRSLQEEVCGVWEIGLALYSECFVRFLNVGSKGLPGDPSATLQPGTQVIAFLIQIQTFSRIL